MTHAVCQLMLRQTVEMMQLTYPAFHFQFMPPPLARLGLDSSASTDSRYYPSKYGHKMIWLNGTIPLIKCSWSSE